MIIKYRTSKQPFAEKKYIDIEGVKMAYIDEGDPILFLHGNPSNEIGKAIASFVQELRK